jgi:hypothetical protein
MPNAFFTMKLQTFLSMHRSSCLVKEMRLALRRVHTCNVTAYRIAVTLQVTDTIRSYDLKFIPCLMAQQYPASVTPGGSQFVTGASSSGVPRDFFGGVGVFNKFS